MLKWLERKFRVYFPKHIKNKDFFTRAVQNQVGIEIGGPSALFRRNGLLPIYRYIKKLDGCNFSSSTVWEGNLKAGYTFNYEDGNPAGYQFIAEGDDLSEVKDSSYDFVLSCHNLEHFANPLKALYEWKRIVKKDGHLILVLPNKEKTFDHNRPVTTLQHLLEDYQNKTPESDETHFEETISLHDISMDAGVASKQELTARTYKNLEFRCVHHHVFNKDLVIEMLQQVNYEIISTELSQIHIFVLAKNLK